MLKQSLQHIKELFRKPRICGLRQAIQQVRDNDESFQYELFKIAQAKGYYTSPETATPEQINKVKNELDK